MITKFKLYEHINYLNSKELNNWISDTINLLNEKFHNNNYPDRFMWNDFDVPYYYIELFSYYGNLKYKTVEPIGNDKTLFTYSFEDSENMDIQVFFDKIEKVKREYLKSKATKKFKI